MSRPLKSCLLKTATIFSALTLGLAGAAAFAQATVGAPITEDSQVAYTLTGTGFTDTSTIRGVATAPDGTIFAADSAGLHIVMITPAAGGILSLTGLSAGTLLGTVSQIGKTIAGSPSITLTGPTAVAVDSAGNLFIADGGTRLIKVTSPESAMARSAAAVNYGGANPVALGIDPTTSALYIADEAGHKIYSLPLGATTATSLALDSGSAKPVGVAADSSSNIYYADENNNEVFVRNTAGNNTVYADPTNGYAFKFSSTSTGATYPISMGVDADENLYVLDTGTGTTNTPASRLFEIPTANYFYLVPFADLASTTSTSHPTGFALDALGNIDLADDTNNALDYLFYNNPLNFGSVDAGTTTPSVVANFQFNTAGTTTNPASTPTSYQSVQGEYTGEFTQIGTTCAGTLSSTCIVKYTAKYLSTTPGLKLGAFGFTDGSTVNNILAVQVNAIDVAGALAIYPGTQTILTQSTKLYEPQAMAVSGDGGNFFIADEGGDFTQNPVTYTHGAVYLYRASGGVIDPSATKLAGFTTPMSVALDFAGDLFVADYDGKVYVIQPTQNSSHVLSWSTTAKTLTLPTGITLSHPMAVTFDPSGNLFIGDSGPLGGAATVASPGFVVEVPSGPLACGTTTCTIDGLPAFTLTNTSISGTKIVYPQSLVTDSTGNLYIGDGGDIAGVDPGGVDVLPLPVSTSTAKLLTLGTLNQPTGLSFDAANNLYIVDAYNGRVLVAHITQSGTTFTVNGNVTPVGTGQSGTGISGLTASLVTPSASVVWPGGQTLTIADIGGGGQSSQIVTLGASNSVNVTVTPTTSASVSEVNTGNWPITFAAPTNSGPSQCTDEYKGTCYALTYSYNLSGSCSGGTSGNTLAVGVANTCAATLSYNGTGTTGSGAITLNGNTGDTYSALGNSINFNGTASGSIGTLTAPTMSFTGTATATLTNTGSGTLTLTSAPTVAGGTIITGAGTTCAYGTALTSNKNCTVTFKVTTKYTSATVTTMDNATSGGTTQTASTFYLPSSMY